MGNPKKVIKYSGGCKLTVSGADNYLTVFVDPDREGKGGLSGRVFEYQSIGFASNPGATIDLMGTIKSLGGAANLAFVGSNFQGGGGFRFSVKTDKDSFNVSENLPEWTGKTWSVRVEP